MAKVSQHIVKLTQSPSENIPAAPTSTFTVGPCRVKPCSGLVEAMQKLHLYGSVQLQMFVNQTQAHHPAAHT